MMPKFFQHASWPVFAAVFGLFLNLKVEGKENLKGLKPPLLVIANHKTFYDCFVYRVALGVGGSGLLPLRFMGAKRFHNRWLNVLSRIGVVGFVYFIFGVFPVIYGQGLDVALKDAKEIIGKGGVVAMFPEGKVVYGDELGQFKRGAAALALMTGVTVLPTAVKVGKRRLFGRRPYAMKFGKPFKIPENASFEDGAEYMRSIVGELRDKTKNAI